MGHDLDFLRYTIQPTVEKNWSAILLNSPESKNAKIDKIFLINDCTMLMKNPTGMTSHQSGNEKVKT